MVCDVGVDLQWIFLWILLDLNNFVGRDSFQSYALDDFAVKLLLSFYILFGNYHEMAKI